MLFVREDHDLGFAQKGRREALFVCSDLLKVALTGSDCVQVVLTLGLVQSVAEG